MFSLAHEGQMSSHGSLYYPIKTFHWKSVSWAPLQLTGCDGGCGYI